MLQSAGRKLLGFWALGLARNKVNTPIPLPAILGRLRALGALFTIADYQKALRIHTQSGQKLL